jgi:hypothetical protein
LGPTPSLNATYPLFNINLSKKFQRGDTMEALERRVDIQRIDVERVDTELWDRRYVSQLVDIAHDYLDTGELGLAETFLTNAKRYASGKYVQEIEALEFSLGIAKMFDTYDKEQELYS